MDVINILLDNQMTQADININMVGQMASELEKPIRLFEDHEGGRWPIPRNKKYYEKTIGSYEGNLFLEHFRMTRPTFENLLQRLAHIRAERHSMCLEKKVLFTIWVLAKPESFLAAGDRFGLARSTAHMVVHILVQIMPQFISLQRHHENAINVFQERSHGFPGVVGAIDGSHIPIKQQC